MARAPKQWSLGKHETVNSFENWKQNLTYILTLDANFAPFLQEGVTWLKSSKAAPLRGMVDDTAPIPEAARRTAQQKVSMLELMLGQVANYCPVIARNQIIKSATSITHVWQIIRAHFGFQSTGGHFLDIADFKREADERPEDLFQRLTAFVEDNLLSRNDSITHHGQVMEEDEEITPTIENFIVVTWLKLVHPDLPKLIKQRYGTELRSRTLASIKPEISLAMDSLLDELHSQSASAMRASTGPANPSRDSFRARMPSSTQRKVCPLCKQAGRPNFSHFLSQCKHLPEADRKYMTKARMIAEIFDEEYQEYQGDQDAQCDGEEPPLVTPQNAPASVRKVQVSQSPYLDAFYLHHTPRITIDSGATANLISKSMVDTLGVTMTRSSQSAGQADGISKLKVLGETKFTLSRGEHRLHFGGLVVETLDVPILAGTPFMETNDVHIRPARFEVHIGENTVFRYGSSHHAPSVTIRRAVVLRAPARTTTIWPGEYIEVDIPPELTSFKDASFTLEPRFDAPSAKYERPVAMWPQPTIISAVSGILRIPNLTNEPRVLKKHEHFCQVLPVHKPDFEEDASVLPQSLSDIRASSVLAHGFYHSDAVSIDPHNILPPGVKQDFQKVIREYDTVFDPNHKCYNGAAGPFQAVINMGPVQPPQRKGKVPQYSRDKLVELQQKMRDLEDMGILVKPEDVNVSVEYLNPSFLVRKPNGGTRLVTAFGEVGQYSKPQPSLMPNVESTLQNIGQWNYIIATDLTSAFYQIPLSRDSMKYCGVVTPFQGSRVYARCAMGMPGSETALEEVMCRVLGDLLEEGIVAKIADDLYCGGESPTALLANWKRVLSALRKCELCLSASKTFICPKTTTILGWIWELGTLRASPHRLATLSTCDRPVTVKNMRSYIGAYKFLSRVIPGCASILSPLESATIGLQSRDRVLWSDSLVDMFNQSQLLLKTCKSITLPRPQDQVWIVTDGAVKDPGIGATMYVSRGNKLLLAGFYSAKLRDRQTSWLPCEVEALAIAAAIKHFSPYIIQSVNPACILTDSKPCVQAYNKLCRGEFSSSPRLSTFLSTVCRYQASVLHLAGKVNIPSDFASRNAPPCEALACQVCTFVRSTEESTVLRVSTDGILSGHVKLPYTTRSTWLTIQSECADMRRVHAHLTQGTRPSKKVTNIRDVKRYLNNCTISKDGLLVVRRNDPLQGTRDCIVVPRQVLHGLLTALHIRLDHPSSHQLKTVVQRYFYALDIAQAVDHVTSGCHQCCALRKAPQFSIEQSTSDPPESLCRAFAADVLKRNLQLIFVLRECVTSYTATCLIQDERSETLRSALLRTTLELRPLDGPPAVVKTDSAPGFASLVTDKLLTQHGLSIEIGRAKNINKNPIAERAVQELEAEIRRDNPTGGQLTSVSLAIATARLNSRIRSGGLSSRELLFQRDQFTNTQLPLDDQKVIIDQSNRRHHNHQYSETSKGHNHPRAPAADIHVGDVVYLYNDNNKHTARQRYLVTNVEGAWCNIRKFAGAQLRNTSYRVKLSDCYKVSPSPQLGDVGLYPHDTYDEDEVTHVTMTGPEQAPIPPLTVPHELSHPEGPLLNSIPDLPDDDVPDTKNDVPEAVPSSDIRDEDTISETPGGLPVGPRRSTRVRNPPPYLMENYVP